MKIKKTQTIDYFEYDSKSELNSKDQEILDKAIAAAANAYAPYSEFKVGAAVLLDNGNVVIGSNQENMAYPSGLCAERVALFSASAQFPSLKTKLLAIYAEKAESIDQQISPCGSCRQVMEEYESKQKASIRVLLMNSYGKVWEFTSCADLLPFAFEFSPLKKT